MGIRASSRMKGIQVGAGTEWKKTGQERDCCSEKVIGHSSFIKRGGLSATLTSMMPQVQGVAAVAVTYVPPRAPSVWHEQLPE